MTTVANGVNVQALLDAREVLKGAPEAAQFTWRASAKWRSGEPRTPAIAGGVRAGPASGGPLVALSSGRNEIWRRIISSS